MKKLNLNHEDYALHFSEVDLINNLINACKLLHGNGVINLRQKAELYKKIGQIWPGGFHVPSVDFSAAEWRDRTIGRYLREKSKHLSRIA